MTQSLILLGHSANTQRLLDLAHIKKIQVIGIVDDNYFGNTKQLDGVPILGSEQNIATVLDQHPTAKFFINSSLRNGADNYAHLNPRRIGFIRAVEQYHLPMINLIHPSAEIPATTQLGTGIYIGTGTVFQNYVTVEDYAFIKEQVCVAHNSVIKQNVTLSTQAYVGSYVCVHENSYIGIKSCLIAAGDQLTLGQNCVTHPGVIVMKDIPHNSTVTIGGKIRGVFDPATVK